MNAQNHNKLGCTKASLIISFIIGLLCCFSSEITAKTIVINPIESLQAAIDGAVAGDIILLNEGTYNGNPISVDKSLTIAGKPYFDSGDISKISDVIIDTGTGPSITAFVTGISTVDKVTILGMKFIGDISINPLTAWGEIEVGYCIFDGGRDLFSLESSGYGEIHHSQFRNANDDNIDVDSRAIVPGAFIHIHDNLIEDSNDDGIEIRFYPRGNLEPVLVYDINHNIFRGIGKSRGDAIQLIDHDIWENSRIIKIYNNIIDGKGLTEVGVGSLDNLESNEDFAGADGMNEAVYIYNNTIFHTHDYGIIGGDHTFVVNNIIVDSPVGIKHVAHNGKVDYTLTYNTPSGSFSDIIDGGHNFFNQEPGLDQSTYELTSVSFCIDKGINSYTDHNLETNIFSVANFRGNALDLYNTPQKLDR